MNELKPGDKVLVKATVNMQYKQHVSLYQQCGIPNYAWHVPISSIHRDPTEELERLRVRIMELEKENMDLEIKLEKGV